MLDQVTGQVEARSTAPMMAGVNRAQLRADVLQAALDYAAHDRRLLPVWPALPGGRCGCGKPDCKDAGKHPNGDLAPHGLHDASSDPHVIRAWLRRYPDANIALAIPAGWVVVDVDPRNGGDVMNLPLSWQDRQTLTQDTGGGGQHLIYTLPPAPEGQRWVNGSLGAGLDVKTSGGYILLAPSNHRSGGRYAWADDLGPADVQPLAAPAALCSILPTVPINWKAPATRTRAAGGQQHDYGRKFETLLSGLCPDLATGQRAGFVSSPFSPTDSSPSLHYDLDQGVWYDFGAGSRLAGTGGGYLALRDASIKWFGYDPEKQVMTTQPETMIPTSPTAAGSELFKNEKLPAVTVIGPLPWGITAEDRRTCTICGAFSTRLSGRAILGTHIVCGRRSCIIASKLRARKLLGAVVGWGALFVGAVVSDPRSWRALRDLAKHQGGQIIGVPLTSGGLLAASSVELEGLRATRWATALQALYLAVIESPERKRVRCGHADQGTEAAGAGVNVQMDIHQAPAVAPLPAGLTSKMFKLTVTPDYEPAVFDLCREIGAEFIAGPRGWRTPDLTDGQLFNFAAGVAALQAGILADIRKTIRGIASIVPLSGSSERSAFDAAVAPEPEHARHSYAKGPLAAEERRRERLPELPEWLQ